MLASTAEPIHTVRLLRYLLPYRRFELESPLPPSNAVNRLARSVGPWSDPPGSQAFRGEIGEGRFFIRRDDLRGNGYIQPFVRGTIEPHGSGSRIRGSMTLHPAFVILMAILLGGPVAQAMAAIADGDPVGIVMLMVPLAVWAVFSWVFAGAVRDARLLLIQRFKAREVD
jgi:hypothetical protein